MFRFKTRLRGMLLLALFSILFNALMVLTAGVVWWDPPRGQGWQPVSGASAPPALATRPWR